MVQKCSKNSFHPYGKLFFRSLEVKRMTTFAAQKRTINPINDKEYERLFKLDAFGQ